jgi:hypothetical protein
MGYSISLAIRRLLVLWGVCFLHETVAWSANEEFAAEIRKGEEFLANLFEPGLDLLPEYKGAKVYWLYHDNYLAAKLLEPSHPDLARRIQSAIHRFGVEQSGKIELLFGEAKRPVPFRTYQLLEVTNVSGKVIKTERVTNNLLKGWEAYADLLLMASIAQAKSELREAKTNYHRALQLWDGRGFADPAQTKSGIYATYKLALAIVAADALGESLPFRSGAVEQLRRLQSNSGGWITDYTSTGSPHGLANVETTCLTLIALKKR